MSSSFMLAGLAEPSSDHTNQTAGTNFKLLPSKIVAADGKTYNSVKLVRVEPDGVVLEYRPDYGGTGLAKLKFGLLPESLQKQFGYNEEQASVFEMDQVQVAAEVSKKLRGDEETSVAARGALERVEPVVVEMSEPYVEYVYYDPTGPKPPLVPRARSSSTHPNYCYTIQYNEGLTFDCKQEKEGGPFTFRFKTMKVILALPIIITLPNNPSDKLRAYEEGRRKLYEHFYRAAVPAARRAGAIILGHEFTATFANFESAKSLAAAKASLAALPEYRKYTQEVAAKANKFYDELTDFGRNEMDPEKALLSAIEQYKVTVPE